MSTTHKSGGVIGLHIGHWIVEMKLTV